MRNAAASSLAACSRAEMTAALLAKRKRGPHLPLRFRGQPGHAPRQMHTRPQRCRTQTPYLSRDRERRTAQLEAHAGVDAQSPRAPRWHPCDGPARHGDAHRRDDVVADGVLGLNRASQPPVLEDERQATTTTAKTKASRRPSFNEKSSISKRYLKRYLVSGNLKNRLWRRPVLKKTFRR